MHKASPALGAGWRSGAVSSGDALTAGSRAATAGSMGGARTMLGRRARGRQRRARRAALRRPVFGRWARGRMRTGGRGGGSGGGASVSARGVDGSTDFSDRNDRGRRRPASCVLRHALICLSAEWGRRADFYTRTPLLPVGRFNRD
jgi:hypothetical protein